VLHSRDGCLPYSEDHGCLTEKFSMVGGRILMNFLRMESDTD
jgi:hypothetical protein